MTNSFTTLSFAALLCMIGTTVQAEEIIWKQPSTEKVYHQNLNFEGNSTLYKSDVRKVQKALAGQGYYKGQIDGIWGGLTSQAILDYQAVHQQALTGTLTVETIRDLGVRIDEDRYK